MYKYFIENTFYTEENTFNGYFVQFYNARIILSIFLSKLKRKFSIKFFLLTQAFFLLLTIFKIKFLRHNFFFLNSEI